MKQIQYQRVHHSGEAPTAGARGRPFMYLAVVHCDMRLHLTQVMAESRQRCASRAAEMEPLLLVHGSANEAAPV